jgi:hypothetical protein
LAKACKANNKLTAFISFEQYISRLKVPVQAAFAVDELNCADDLIDELKLVGCTQSFEYFVV